MRKIVLICMALALTLSTAAYADGLGLKAGAAASLDVPIDLETFTPAEPIEKIGPDKFKLGGDIRLNMSVFEFSSLFGAKIDQGKQIAQVDGYFGVGGTIELLGLVDLALTAGPRLSVQFNPEGVFVGAMVYTEEGVHFDPVAKLDKLLDLPLVVRATAEVNLGSLSVGAFIMVDSHTSILKLQSGDKPKFSPYGKAGVSLLFNIL